MNETPRVLVTRAAAQAASSLAALRHAGLAPVLVPAIEIEAVLDGGIDEAATCLHAYRWVVVTSPNGVAAILAAAERVETQLAVPGWAAIGASTRRVLEVEGIEVAFTPTSADGAALADELPVAGGEAVLVIRGDLAGTGLATALRRRGAEVDDVVAYRTVEAPPSSVALLRAAFDDGHPAAVVFTSGSTVRGLVTLAREASIRIRGIPAVCIGHVTAEVADAAGFEVVAVAASPDPAALATATAAAIARQPVEVT